MEKKSGSIIYEKKDKIAFVTLNLPEKDNALTSEAIKKLRDIWADYESDPEMHVAILTGSGRTF